MVTAVQRLNFNVGDRQRFLSLFQTKQVVHILNPETGLKQKSSLVLYS